MQHGSVISIVIHCAIHMCLKQSCGARLDSALVNGNVSLEPDELQHLNPEADWGGGERCLVGINQGSIPDKVDLVGLEPLSLLDDLPEGEGDGSNQDHGVVGEEVSDGEVSGSESLVAIDKDNADLEAEREPSAVGLEVAAVGESLAVESLDLASLVEGKVGCAHNDEVDDTSGGDDVGEPGEDLGGVVGELEEGQEGEDHDDSKAVDGNTVLSDLAQEPGSTAFDGKRVQGAGRAVGIGVSSGEDGGDEKGIDEMRKTANLEVLHGNDIRRGSSGTLTSREDVNELGVVVGENNTNAEGAEDEESTETEVDGLEGVLDVDTGTLGLTSDHGNVLRTDNTERSSPERTKETFKATKISIAVAVHWARVAPVAESVGVLERVATDHGDKGEEVEDQDQNDLSTGEPKFGFTVGLDSENIASTVSVSYLILTLG